MTARITNAVVVGGHDGRAELEVEVTYPNGGVASISLDEEAWHGALDRAGIGSIDDLVGQPWSIVLEPADHQHHHSQPHTNDHTAGDPQ